MQDRELYTGILGIRTPWNVVEVKADFGAREVKEFIEAHADAKLPW